MDCRLIVVRVFVRDWPRARAFYRETLGLRVAFASAEMGWAQFDTGEAQLAIEGSSPGVPTATCSR